MPQISVIIPVYNVQAYVEQCVRSVLDQTFKDIEVICVDSISTDNSPRILQKLAQQDARVRVFCLEKIRGLGRGRNRGLDEARGKYVFFLDSDDFLAPQALESLYNTAETESRDIVTCLRYNYDDKTHAISNENLNLQLPHQTVLCEQDTKMEFAKFAFSSPFAWGKLFRRDIIERLLLRFPDGAVEDVPFTVSYLVQCRRAKQLPDFLVYYRTGRAGSISGKNEKMLLDGIKNFAWLEKNLRAYGVFEEVKETFWFNKMVLLIGDERVFAGRMGNVPLETVQQAYDLLRDELATLDISLFKNRNAWFKWKVRRLQHAVTCNNLKFPRRLRRLRNILMVGMNPYYQLKSKLFQ